MGQETDDSVPCRGACNKTCDCGETCKTLLNQNCAGKWCWRKFFRQALKVSVCMLQVAEWDEGTQTFALGGGQKIEEEIARLEKKTIIRIEIPNEEDVEDAIAVISAAIEDVKASGDKAPALIEIKFQDYP